MASMVKTTNAMSFQKYFLLGISGTTNSGKSTVASMLQKTLPCSEVICQDNYFWEPDDPRVEREEDGTRNWEKLSALDMDAMVRDVKSWIDNDRQHSKNSISVLIVEGFLIFNHSILASLFDKKYLIKGDEKACKERRVKRVYNQPDPPGYFEKIAWPFYLKNLDDLGDQQDIEYLDGSADVQTLYEKILTDVQLALSQKI